MKELMFSHRGQTYGTSVGEFRSFKKQMQKLVGLRRVFFWEMSVKD